MCEETWEGGSDLNSDLLPLEAELVSNVSKFIKLRWFVPLLVIAGTAITSAFFRYEGFKPLPFFIIGFIIGAYNIVFYIYLRKLGEQRDRLRAFHRFANIQIVMDWIALSFLVHLSGGVESPVIFFFIFHIIIACILLPSAYAYVHATLASVLLLVVFVLEYNGVIQHYPSPFLGLPEIHKNLLYIGGAIVLFSVVAYLSVFLASPMSSSLRKREKDLSVLKSDLEGANQRLKALYEVATTIGSTLDPQKVMDLIAENAVRVIEVKASSIRLLDESGGRLLITAAYGLSRSYLDKGSVDIGRSVIDRQALSGKPVVVLDATNDPRFQYPEEAKKEGIRSVLCVPLKSKEKVIGVIRIYKETVEGFTDDQVEFISLLAALGAIAIENARFCSSLEEMDRLRSKFILMVSHELRAPLSAIQSILRVVLDGYAGDLPEKGREIIARAERRANFLIILVNDLLDLAIGRAENAFSERISVDLGSMALDITSEFDEKAREKGVKLRANVAEESVRIIAVEDDIRKVLDNLVGNAIKYTPPGGEVCVKVGLEDGTAQLEVSDTGIGIPEDALPKVFDEFYRAQNARAIESEGTGLGLSIIKRIVEQHLGSISVESEIGKGSIFRVSFPISAPELGRKSG